MKKGDWEEGALEEGLAAGAHGTPPSSVSTGKVLGGREERTERTFAPVKWSVSAFGV